MAVCGQKVKVGGKHFCHKDTCFRNGRYLFCAFLVHAEANDDLRQLGKIAVLQRQVYIHLLLGKDNQVIYVSNKDALWHIRHFAFAQ